MNDKLADQESYRTFQLMHELESGQAVSQRELAGRLGIAVGLVNSYLKNLVAKGFIRVKAFPRNRYAYLLTPKGAVEKGRLAMQHLNYFTSLYTTTRTQYLDLFRRLKAEGAGGVVFCGVDEVAEIAYLSLRETGLRLEKVMDDAAGGGTFFEFPIVPLAAGIVEEDRQIVVTSLKRKETLYASLRRSGVEQKRIHLAGGGQ